MFFYRFLRHVFSDEQWRDTYAVISPFHYSFIHLFTINDRHKLKKKEVMVSADMEMVFVSLASHIQWFEREY